MNQLIAVPAVVTITMWFQTCFPHSTRWNVAHESRRVKQSAWIDGMLYYGWPVAVSGRARWAMATWYWAI